MGKPVEIHQGIISFIPSSFTPFLPFVYFLGGFLLDSTTLKMEVI
jgi:hypothetical protein